jgi:hypothetical protein
MRAIRLSDGNLLIFASSMNWPADPVLAAVTGKIVAVGPPRG